MSIRAAAALTSPLFSSATLYPPPYNSLYLKKLYNNSSEAGLKNKAAVLLNSGATESNKTSVPPDGGNDNKGNSENPGRVPRGKKRFPVSGLSLALVCALALAACSNPAGSGNETETPRKTQFTITLDSAGVTEVPPLTGDEGSKIDKPEDPVLEGYTFLGWFTEPDGGTFFTAWPYTLTGDLTLYARWHDNAEGQAAEYKIIILGNGGWTDLSVIKAYEGSAVGKPGDPVKEGYTFLGWFNAARGGELYTWPHTLKGDLTLYAQWHDNAEGPLMTYTLTFDSAGGTEVPEIKAYEGSAVGKPGDPVKEGYTFLGWYREEKGGKFLSAWPFTLEDDLTMYAQWIARSYTVTFDSRAGSAVESVTLGYGDQIKKPGDPALEGFIFQGWYNTAEGGELYSWPLTLKENVTIYAQWISAFCTITFNSGRGTGIPPVTGNRGSQINKPSGPAREGYSFRGWYNAAEGGELYSWPHTLTGDLTMYAQWIANGYTITFDSRGGSAVAPVIQEYGTRIEKPGDPALMGYAFRGWYSAAEGGTKYSWPHTLTGDLTMYAQWVANGYTITFDSRGGSAVAPVTQEYRTRIEKPGDPALEGFIFQGWYSAAEGGTKYSWPDTLIRDLTMYAQWTGISYTAVYYGNGAESGSVTPTQHIYGTESPLAENGFAKDGYVFGGWNTQADGLGLNYSAGRNVTDMSAVDSEIVILYARWVRAGDPIYTISFESNGGSPVEEIRGNKDTSAPSPDDPTRAGYSFNGWYSEPEGAAENKYNWPYTLTGNVTMYAQWTLVTYTITYNLNGGSGAAENPASYTYESQINLLDPPARTGYDFGGWYDNAALSGTAVISILQGSRGDKVFYAKWTLVFYTITYNLNGGSSVAGNPVSYTIESAAITLSAPTLTGYAFAGWFDNAAFTGEPVASIPAGSAGDKTFWAKWTLVFYTITYNLNGGSSVAGNPVSYTIESAAITLAAPARAGYTFGGWYANANLTGSAAASIPQKSTGDKTFWAKWTPVSYTITYNLNGGSNAAGNPVSYTVESAAITLADPVRANYVFGGWYANANLTGSAIASIPQKSTGDKSFWAKWTLVSYTITYNLNGGSNAAGNPVSYTVESAAITLADPVRANHVFGGWYGNAVFTGEPVASIPAGSSGDKNFYAKWTPTYKVIYNGNGGSGSVASSVHVIGRSNVLAANGFTLPGYVFAGWNTQPDGGGTLYWAGRDVSDLASSAGAEVPLYARWLPVEQTIELDDNPTRGWGHNAAGALLWQFFPERKEFVVFAGQDYKSKADSTVYVTGRTTVNRIRVLPGRSLNTWAMVPDYSISQAYSYMSWGGVADGYVPGQVIPTPVLLGNVVNAHQIRIIFVNAEIKIPSVQGENSRSPLDIGPYHTFWEDDSWEGDFYQSLGGDLLNDHEIYASVEFEGKNKLYSPSSPGIALWDSRAVGAAYNNEIPWQPHSNSWTSWKTKNNLPHWVEYVKKCLDFARKWGYPYDYSPQDGSVENGPGVVGHRFQSFGWGPSVLDVAFRGGGSLSASTGGNGFVELSGLYEIIPANGNAWTQRATTE